MNQRKAGVLLSYVSTGLTSVTMLVYVPMMLHYISKEQYGVYQLMGSFLAALSVMDFGLGNGITRFLAQAQARNDPKAQQDILVAARNLYILVAIGVLGMGALLYGCIPPLYAHTLTPAELHCAQQIFLVLLVNIVCSICLWLFLSIMFAREKFIQWQLINLVSLTSTPLLIWAVLAWKANVLYMAGTQTLGNMLVLTTCYLYCHYGLRVRFPWKRSPLALIKQLTRFSLAVFIANVAGQVYWRIGGFVLGAVIGATAVANYYISSQICMFFIVLSVQVGGVFLPKLSSDSAVTVSLQSHNEVWARTGRLQGMLALLILTGFILLGKQFLQLWLGPGNEVCFWPAVILMTGYTLEVIQSVAGTALQAMDRYSGLAKISLCSAVCNALLAIPLARTYGVEGCALAAAVCLWLVLGIAGNIYYARCGLDVKNFWREVAPVLGGTVISAGILYAIWHLWPLGTGKLDFIAHGCVVVAVYGAVMAAFVLNRFEWDVVRECWQFIRSGGRAGFNT